LSKRSTGSESNRCNEGTYFLAIFRGEDIDVFKKHTQFNLVDFSVRCLDNQLAPSATVQAVIHIDPINHAPYFKVLKSGNTIDVLQMSNYFLLRGYLADPDFQFGQIVQLTVRMDEGYGQLALPAASAKCQISSNNLTLVCLDLIEKINSWFYDSKGQLGVPVYYSQDSTFSTYVYFHVDDLGNIDKNHPPHNLSANTKVLLTQSSALVVSNVKPPTSSVVSIAVGVGLLAAVLVSILAVWYFWKSKNATDQYLAEFLSSMDTAGTTTSPLYQEATIRKINPLHHE